MGKRLLTCALLVLNGCAPAGEEPTSTGTSTQPPAGTTTTEVEAKPLHASFVREDAPGAGPALLRMFNDSETEVLSLTLDDGQEFTFYLVEPLTVTDYQVTTSDDMWTDAILSIHTQETCIRKEFADITGPLALEPGHAYGIHVSVAEGFVAQIEEDPQPEPFIGFRALVTDPAASSAPAPSELTLSLAGGSLQDVVFNTYFDEYPEPYVLVPASAVEIDSVRFVDRSGAAHESTSPIVIEGGAGYTVHVAPEPEEGAEISIALDAPAE